MLLNFGCLRPMPLHDSWKTGQDTFPFSFSVTLYKFFISMQSHKNTCVFTSKLFFFYVNQPKYIHILCSGKMVAKNDWICTYLEIKWCCLVYRKSIRDFKIWDATAVRRGRKWISKMTYCACSRRRSDGITSRREREFGNFDVLYKTWVYSFQCLS